MVASQQIKCPVCGKPTDEKYKPFCSKKCADIDLGRWLKGMYVMHTEEQPEDDDTPVYNIDSNT